MNKYIPTEKLIAEINRRKELYHEKGGGCDNAIEEELDDLLSFSTSLQQEQPEVDLEKEIEEYFKGWFVDEDLGLVKSDSWSCIVEDVKEVARHFYKLGFNARKEE